MEIFSLVLVYFLLLHDEQGAAVQKVSRILILGASSSVIIGLTNVANDFFGVTD